MIVHVLLNLLNVLGKRDKTRGLLSILFLFRNKIEINNTRAGMLDSIYHDIDITLKSHFCHKNVIILSLCMQHCYGRHNGKPLVVYRFYCMTLFHAQKRGHIISKNIQK